MYEYSRLMRDVGELIKCGASAGSIGLSEMGNEIPYIRIGKEEGCRIIITGAIHARENITARLIMRQASYFLDKELSGSIYFVPMVNVDGCLLMEKGVDAAPKRFKKLLKSVVPSNDFSMFKANANCVDLNVNFDARWGSGASNVRYPSQQNYIGPFPESEAETKSLVTFTKDIKPDATLSYHALGREIYWYFYQDENRKARDRYIAEAVNKTLNYKIFEGAQLSAGGYKDWCVSELKIPAYTVEIVPDSYCHPIEDGALSEEWRLNRDVPKILLEETVRIGGNSRQIYAAVR